MNGFKLVFNTRIQERSSAEFEMQSSKYESFAPPKTPFSVVLKVFIRFKKQITASSAAIFLFATALALYQPVNPNLVINPQGWEHFYYPTEENPQLRLASITTNLTDLATIEQNIWVVGELGTILHSSDGGKCWQPQGRWIEVTNEPVKKANTDKVSNNAESADGCIEQNTGLDRLFSSLGGQIDNLPSNLSFFPKAHAEGDKKKPVNDNQMQFQQNQAPPKKFKPIPNSNYESNIRSVVVDYKNELIEGRPVLTNEVPEFQSVAFANKNYGIAVALNGSIVSTLDGGNNWSNAVRVIDENLNAIDFKAPKNGQQNLAVAVGNSGVILISSNNGQNWKSYQVLKQHDLLDVSINDDGIIVITGESDSAIYSLDQGESWTESETGTNKGFAAFLSDEGETYIAGETGNIDVFLNTGTTRVGTFPASNSAIYSIDYKLGLFTATTENSELLTSTDQGRSWQAFTQPSDTKFVKAAVLSREQVILVGEAGAVISFNPNQQTWQLLTADLSTFKGTSTYRYSVGVAPWWYLVTFICGGLILIVIWPREEQTTPDEGIAGMAASDRPLQPGDPDALNLGKIAADITAFLSNPKTTAPLTLAITGPWGCGKSSLMNLIRADLKDRGFLPVWFNAWHHQKGEQLLASLFAHITQQAIPPWFSFDGFIFRMRLAVIRGRRHWFIFALMMFLLFMTWSINKGDASFINRFQEINWSEYWAGIFGNTSAVIQNNQVESNGGLIQTIASMLGIAAPIIALLRSVRGFGISPEKLVSVDHRNRNQKGYDPGARARFADEFNDVTTALGSNKMVIFIDDLDRCSQDNLIDILENINFISSSGDCYLLLGMAPKYVEACVANAYEKLAQNIAEKERFERSRLANGEEINAISNKEKHKFDFARQYLEKMINIAVSIPSMSENSIERLLHQSEESESEMQAEKNAHYFVQLVHKLKRVFQVFNHAMPLIFIGLAIKAGWDYGDSLPERQPPPKPAVVSLGTIDNESLVNLMTPQQYVELSSGIPSGASLEDSSFELTLEVDKKQATKGLKVASIGSGKDKMNLMLKLNGQSVAQSSTTDKRVNTSGQTSDVLSSRSDSLKPDKSDGKLTLQAKEIDQRGGSSFRQASADTNPRISSALLILGILFFSSFSLYMYRQQKQKFSTDSDDFRNALNIWTPWIQIKQETPRAIKRFLNHLRYQSIRNKRAISESLLVAYATIAFFEKSWILNEQKFQMICDGQIAELLQSEYQTNKSKKGLSEHLEKLASRMNESLLQVDSAGLRDNRLHALSILQSDTLKETIN